MDQEEWLGGTLRYAGKEAQDKVSVDTLMLRYRPIAPKPTMTGQPCDKNSSHGLNNKRTKRKYVRASKNNNTCRAKNRSDDVSDGREQTGGVVTLQLMPEKSDLTPLDQDVNVIDPMVVETITGEETRETDTWKIFNGGVTVEVETWVTVESVTGVSDGGSSSYTVECTDAEMVDNLSKDTCPAFVSDVSNRVVWVNEAYRRNVSGEEDPSSSLLPDVTVWLVMEESTVGMMYCNHKAFTCRVRMQYTWKETKYTKTVPCDVWRMEFGGFAWRLDTTAALTLWL